MTPEAGLVQDIRENPDDDTPRLVFADWLEENDRLGCAELIRASCALAGMERGTDDWLRVRRRENALIEAHKEEWVGPMRAHWSFWEMERGFVEEVATSIGPFLEHAEALFRYHPVFFLRLGGLTPHLAESVANCPQLALPREVHLSNSAPPGARPHDLGVRPILTLARSPNLARLTRLHVLQGGIGPEGLEALVESPHLARLVDLDASGRGDGRQVIPNVGNEGALLLAASPASARFARINLTSNRIDPQGARALLDSPHLSPEVQLILGDARAFRAPQREALVDRFGEQVFSRWE